MQALAFNLEKRQPCVRTADVTRKNHLILASPPQATRSTNGQRHCRLRVIVLWKGARLCIPEIEDKPAWG